MPIFMVALVALVAFGLIGFLLAAAVICESRQQRAIDRRPSSGASVGKPAA